MKKMKLAVLLLVASRIAFGTISFVPSNASPNNGGASGSGGTLAITMGTTPTAGNALIVVVIDAISPEGVSSVNGGGVTSWVQAADTNNMGLNGGAAEIWYGLNNNGSSGAVNVVMSAGAGTSLAYCFEVTGMPASGTAVDVTGTATGTSQTIAAALGSNTTKTGDLIIAVSSVAFSNTQNSGPTGSFSNLPVYTPFMASAYYLPGTDGSTFATSWSYANQANYASVEVAFLPAPAVNALKSQGAYF